MIEDTTHLKKRRSSPPWVAGSLDCGSSSLVGSSNNCSPPPSPRPPLHLSSLTMLVGEEEKKEYDLSLLNHGNGHATHILGANNGRRQRSFSAVTTLAALSALFVAPLLLWDAYPAKKYEVLALLRHVELIWVALLHISVWPVVGITAALATCLGASSRASCRKGGSCSALLQRVLLTPKSSVHYKMPLLLSFTFSGLISTQSFLQMAFPSIVWNPAIWGGFRHKVYSPADIERNWRGGCFHEHHRQFGEHYYDDSNSGHDATSSTPSALSSSSSLLRSNTSSHKKQLQRRPLCLSEQQWSHLSSGTLSSRNAHDVATVRRGLQYLQTQSRGIVINALARNIRQSIPDLRLNIEGLVPLLGEHTKLSLVVFENDSVDGTREELMKWAEEVNLHPESSASSSSSRYNVDVIQCPPPNTDCKLNIIDRNEIYGGENKTASGVGKLGDFRQIVLEHVVKNYGDYSHMIVLDVDLGVSLSPLGIVHTLGLSSDEEGSGEDGQIRGDSQEKGGGVLVAEKYVVASAATQVWPGTFGTILAPYDLSAFRPKPTSANSKVRSLHRKFCTMMPPGDRWRNMCDAPSPMQFFMILQNNDPLFHHYDPYEVQSAFNGLTMYPLGLIRERGNAAKYDAGKDGQRCEHIGFHLSLRDTMMVNPKWTMHLKPNKPGGPNGFDVIYKVFHAMSKRRNVTSVISAVNCISFFVFVWAVWVISLTMKESVIPNMIDFFQGLRNRSEMSFLFGYWLDFTGRGGGSSHHHSNSPPQYRVVGEEEGKKLLS